MKKTLIFMTLCLLVALATSAAAADFVVIVNPDNPVSSLSVRDAKNIFLGKKGNWDNGGTIVLYSQFNSVLTDAFAGDVLGKSAQQFSTFWKKALFTGTGRPPVELKDDAEMKKFIAADPKGIGYISASAVDGSVKVVKLH